MTPLPGAAPRYPPRALAGAVGLAVVAATLLFTSAPAGAHPFLREGGAVPVDSAVTITLDLAHGCGSEVDGIGDDTLEVALEVPSWLRVLSVAEHPAYRHDLEMADGRVAVVSWTAVGTTTSAPAFELDVVATGTAGEVRHLAVFQSCGERSHRWIGTPQEPADDPAIDVRLTAADPARPAPPDVPPDAPTDASAGEAPTDARDEATAPADPQVAEPDARDDEAVAGERSAAASGARGDGRDADGWLASPRRVGLLAAIIGGGLVVLALAGRRRAGTDHSTPS